MMIGYARVSTAGQDLAGQVAALEAAGAESVVTETASGAAGRNRRELERLIRQARPGDVVIVVRLDRLARSARDALNILARLGAAGVGFRSLAEAWTDTTTAHGRLMVTLFAGLAEFDREMILARTREGRASAMARGVKMGRPPRLTGAQLRYVLEARAANPPTSIAQICAVTGAARSTIRRAILAAAGGQTRADGRPRQIDLEAAIAARSPARAPPGAP